MAPMFSIITVTFNAASTLPATLKSVKEQTCTDFEYIVIDGKSSDSTVELVRQAAIPHSKIVSEPDNGLYDAMNKGLGMAHGNYLIFLNAGDRFHSPDTLQQYHDAIMANDYPGVVYGQTQIVDGEGRRLGDRHLRAPEKLTLKSFRNGMLVCHQAFCANAKVVSTYDTSYRFSSDYDWCVRCLMHSRHNVYIDDIVIDYLSEGVTTANHRASLIERFRIMSHYYGLVPTMIRHIGFLVRNIFRKPLK
nr:glycosyltransferase [Bacteroides sp.]